MAAEETNHLSFKGAVLLNKEKVSAHEWEEYVEENWERLSQRLENATVLIMTGRHGEEDGTIGNRDPRIISWHQRVVSLHHLKI